MQRTISDMRIGLNLNKCLFFLIYLLIRIKKWKDSLRKYFIINRRNYNHSEDISQKDGYRKRYNKTIKKLHRRYRVDKFLSKFIKEYKPRKIKVLFTVSQNQKWSSDSLYKSMEKDDLFDPYIVITPIIIYTDDNLEQVYRNNYEFFNKKKFKILSGFNFKLNQHHCLNDLKPDIVFYQQQYCIPKNQNISITSKRALNCWIPYSIIIGNYIHDYGLPFQHNMWKIFLDSYINVERFQKLMGNKGINCVASGYPKIDHLIKCKNTKTKGKMVIYAPHHTFEESGQRFATFQWNGFQILDFVKKHPEIDFVLKPHPRFREAIISNNIMTKDQIDDYYKFWLETENTSIYDQGDYLDLFLKSSAMITDCVSFLAEYSLTKKPLFHLFSKYSKGYNKLGEDIISCYYRINNPLELDEILYRVLIENDDYMKTYRDSIDIKLIKREEGSGEFIKNYIKDIIKYDKDT